MITNKAKRVVSIVYDSIKAVIVSTAFRHRLTVAVVPVAVYVVDEVQVQLTAHGLNGIGLVVTASVCTWIVNKLRGTISPA